MDEGRKELSKRFFILLYLFLTRHYEKIELVFIRHHTQAQEVDEENFFHARETGGTVVSSALVLMRQGPPRPTRSAGSSPERMSAYVWETETARISAAVATETKGESRGEGMGEP
jgi:hypothetical protein